MSVNMINNLLSLTKKTYSFPVEYSKDCENLSHAIFNKTNCSISPTTLKRLLGFAKVKDKPSKYTLNTLSVYCGFTDWNDFIKIESDKNTGDKKSIHKWEELKQNANSVSQYTLEVLKNNSGLNYNQTLKRKYIYSFIDEFLESGAVATCLIGDGGTGKSISMAHLIDDYWLSKSPKYKNDIVWFVSGTNLRSLFSNQLDLESWFLDLFSLTKGVDYRGYFSKNPKQRKGNIILIIDALDEFVVKSDDLDDLFLKITELVGSNVETPWFKFILSIRTSTFERFIHTIKDHSGVTKYFYGVNFDNQTSSPSNVPLLNEEEIIQIFEKVATNQEFNANKIDYASLNPALRLQITHPYYLQLFIQSFIEKSTDIHSNHDILNEFMRHRIYKGKYGFEKTEIFNAILTNTDYGRKSITVKKSDIVVLINQYSRAYKELLSFGILKENSVQNKFKVYQTFIKFGHDTLYEFLIAKHWIMEFKTYSHKLLLSVAKTYSGKEKRIDIINHIALMGLEESSFEELQYLFELPLEEYELNSLSHILGIQIRENVDAQNILIPLWAKNKSAQIYFFERFVDLDNLNGYYGHAISLYLKHKKTKEAQIFGNCLLSKKAFLSNDESLFWSTSNKIEKNNFDLSIHPFPLGRQMANQIISYRKFNQRGLNERFKNKIISVANEISRTTGDTVTGFPAGYHFHVMEGLFLSKEYSELIITLFEQVTDDFPEISNYNKSWLYNMMLVYYSTALYFNGSSERALKIFNSIQFELAFKDTPWYKNYYFLQYLTAKRVMIKKATKSLEHKELGNKISMLSEKLGFSYFNR